MKWITVFTMMIFLSLNVFTQEEEELKVEEVEQEKEDVEKKTDEEVFPAIMEVTSDKLNVRAGIGTNFRLLTVLDKGTKVIALRKEFDWIRIKPPKNVCCWIHKDFVKVDGEKGTITGSNVNLRPTPGTEHPPMGQLNQDDEVKIISFDEVRGYYKIEASDNAESWVSAKYVKFVDIYNEENFKKYFGEDETYSPVDVSKIKDTNKKEDEKKDKLPTDKEMLTQFEKKFWEIERIRLNELDKSPESQNYSKLISLYNELGEAIVNSKISGTDVLKNKIEFRLNQLKKLQSLLDNYLDALRKKEERIREVEKSFKSAIDEINVPKQRKQFNATGYVASFGVVINAPATHKLVKGNQVIYYLTSANENIDLDKYVGLYVGVVGQEEESADQWKPTKILKVLNIEVIE